MKKKVLIIALNPNVPTLVHAARRRILARDYIHYCREIFEQMQEIFNNLVESGLINAYSLDLRDIDIGFSCQTQIVAGHTVFNYEKIMISAEIDVEKSANTRKIVSSLKNAIEELGWEPIKIEIR